MLEQLLWIQHKGQMINFKEEETTEYTAFLLLGAKKIRLVSWPTQRHILHNPVFEVDMFVGLKVKHLNRSSTISGLLPLFNYGAVLYSENRIVGYMNFRKYQKSQLSLAQYC